MMLQGYQENLPAWAKKGQRVRILKGTLLHSMYPGQKPYPARRDYTVVIDHTLCGRTITIGVEYDETARGEGVKFFWERKVKDIAWAAERFGYTGRWGHFDEDNRDIEAFMKSQSEKILRSDKDGLKVYEYRLHAENPQVRWPGRGGYWVGADINVVIPVED